MPFHAESLVSRLGLQKMSRSYFVSGRSTYLDPSPEGQQQPACCVVYLPKDSVVNDGIITKEGDVLVSTDGLFEFKARGDKFSMQVFDKDLWKNFDLEHPNTLKRVNTI